MWNLLKVNSRDCVSLLTTCKMSIPLSSVSLVYYEHVFVYCDAFKNLSYSSVISFRTALSRWLGWVKVNTITKRSSQ